MEKPDKASENTRIITPMPKALVARIDREWHKRELPSRSETIRELIKEALTKA
jgi:metal-responsive CopG/Arc/MetJ family transcriptional regulator